MKFYYLNTPHSSNEKVGLTIGNFDGLHLGHQSLIQNLKKHCLSAGYRSAILTFNPHPVQILRPQNNFLINSYDRRAELIKEIGIDIIVEIGFDRDFSTLTPIDFFNKYILKIPNLKLMILGHDFSFGSQKTGGANFLKDTCLLNNIEAYVDQAYCLDNKVVSSSKIREFLSGGDVLMANRYLGRTFSLNGTVVKGDGRGKKIGFATANINYDFQRKIPGKGVYATQVQIQGMTFNSVTNIGVTPTFKESDTLSIETHILDFKNEIYGEDINILFYQKIRDEIKFQSVNDLVEQIKSDIQHSKGIRA